MTIWPQILMATALIFSVIGGWIRHGKDVIDPKINGAQIMWVMFMIAAVLGAGGFWKPLGW